MLPARLFRTLWFAACGCAAVGLIAQTATAPRNISPVSPGMRAAMTGISWKPGCPVPLDDLVAVRVKYLGFDGLTHDGTLVVHKRFADDVSHIFAGLYDVHRKITGQISTLSKILLSGSTAKKQTTLWTNGVGTPTALPLTSTPSKIHSVWARNRGGQKMPQSSRHVMTARGKSCRIAGRFKSSRDMAGIGMAYKDETDYMHFYTKTDRRELEVAQPK
jgi:hypothetical protein